jgi:hypothetical protein
VDETGAPRRLLACPLRLELNRTYYVVPFSNPAHVDFYLLRRPAELETAV